LPADLKDGETAQLEIRWAKLLLVVLAPVVVPVFGDVLVLRIPVRKTAVQSKAG
jgi:hypothetical protein